MIPSLVHPISILIEQLDTGETLWDEDAREPIGNAERSAQVKLQAQIQYRKIDDPAWMWTGRDENTLGYLMFEWGDLRSKGITINPGDRIVKTGDRDVDLYVLGFEDAAHYPELDGAGFLVVFFGDRTPASHEGDT